MAISIFPSTAAEFVSNNFVVDMNDTTNNTADTGGVKQAGPYSMSFSSGDSSFDVYLIDDEGNSVGYSNGTSITASALFTTVVILGVAQDEIISFTYQGSVNNADGEGDEPGAGAYLESISPTDLPTIDDTATVTGGNFGADTEIKFESGATVLDAKNITVNNSTELIVTRPDNLDPDLDPYTIRAITTGVPEPTGTNANILTDAVTAGAVPSWVTNSSLADAEINTAYSVTLEATDAEGDVTYTVTTGSLPTGLSLDSSTGVISGTPSDESQTFTVTATDNGGNEATREFTIRVLKATGGTIELDGGFLYHTFTTSDDFVPLATITNAEYLIVAGGGGGGDRTLNQGGLGGGGGGGFLQATATISTTQSATIGAGGAGGIDNSQGSQGTDSSFNGDVSTGGGGGAGFLTVGGDGGSGGGGYVRDSGETTAPGDGVAGQGFDGGDGFRIDGSNFVGGGGGGAGEAGDTNGDGFGGDGLAWLNGVIYAGGGASMVAPGATQITATQGGLGGGGNQQQNGDDGLGGGAGGGPSPGNGGSGVVIVRYAS